jgi:predicted nuclease of predicted toxin-antitoxin system
MKVLLDECIPKKLKLQLPDFDVYTVSELGWSGVKNGQLMTLCVAYTFDILLTIDKNMMYQQNLEKYPVTIVVLNSFTSKVEELVRFIPAFVKRAYSFERHKAYIVEL